MSQDRVGADAVAITHDYLAQMSGSRRATVSLSAGVLQAARNQTDLSAGCQPPSIVRLTESTAPISQWIRSPQRQEACHDERRPSIA
jgi:hypothetical protein